MKDPADTAKFMNSEAYSSLFMELLSDEKKAIEFINGMPSFSKTAE